MPQSADSTHVLSRLSQREQELLSLLAQGMPNRMIAEHMTVATGTVKTHVKHIFRKMGVGNRTEAALKFLEAQGTISR